jgi:small redox-active disulfide protein 2
MEIKVLGPGCAKCNKLHDQVKKILEESSIDATLTKVEKLDEIMAYGVVLTPALVIDGEVKCSGKLPKPDQIAAWIGK